MPTLDANGVRLAYVESGQGPDAVFVHGIPTDLRAWNGQVNYFSKSYRVISYSRRHAQPNTNPGSPSESTIENNAGDLEELIRKITSPPVNLIGHSYGGFVSAYLAANHPDLVKKLVLIEPGISTMLIQNPQSRTQMISLLLKSPSVAFAAGRYLRRYYNPLLDAYRRGDLDTALRFFLDGLMNRTDALRQLSEGVQTMVKENAKTIGEVEAKLPPFTEKDAARISAPTLLINGAEGTKIFLAINQELMKSIPGGEHVSIPRSSHFPHFENSDKFNELVFEFLGRIQ
jgi:non-heme chloroperoxidase